MNNGLNETTQRFRAVHDIGMLFRDYPVPVLGMMSDWECWMGVRES